jgi:hypothetical protein
LEILAKVGNLGLCWKSWPKLDEIINNYNKHQRIDNFLGITDISGCFDQVQNLEQSWKSWP